MAKGSQAFDLLAEPLVLRAAWRRVRRAVTAGDWVPQPETAEFELDADNQLQSIGEQLRWRDYQPAPFRVIAYPKSGGALRHFTVPHPRDQVAFSVFAVLLGPLIDIQTIDFAFGNRWHRSLIRDRSGSSPKWTYRPYSLDSAYFYQPYKRDFSLFRRSAHWAASRLLGRNASEDSIGNRLLNEEEISEDDLPRCCRDDWWGTPVYNAFWARLDLRLAYPSVRLSILRKRLHGMLGAIDSELLLNRLAGYPSSIARALTDPEARTALVDLLVTTLERIRYKNDAVGDVWIPPDISHDVPKRRSKQVGLPTGLTISGSLLNAYLSGFDRRIDAWLFARRAHERSALLRFADDILILSQSAQTVAETLDAVWTALEDDENACLAAPHRESTSSNLRVNWYKVEPSELKKPVVRYLESHGWKESDGRLFEPKELSSKPVKFSSWIDANESRDWLDDAQLNRNRIGPFVTHLVERMSALAGERLADRFGQGARARIDDLHHLIRLDIDDPHVRDDTRLAFAANKLVRAFLPNEGQQSDSTEVAAIRRSIADAVLRVPWKFSFWRAVVHAACRRPFSGEEPADLVEEERVATEWLTGMLRQIADSATAPASWLKKWPETTANKAPDSIARLYLSFLRARFWLALTDAIRDVHRVTRGADEEDVAPTHWSSTAWTFRAFDERRATRIATWLSDLDRWASVLYSGNLNAAHWWEVDSLVLASLAREGVNDFINSKVLVVPRKVGRVGDLLSAAGRVYAGVARERAVEQLAHAALSPKPQQISQLKHLATSAASTTSPSTAAHRLGVVSFLSVAALSPSADPGPPTLRSLESAALLRRALLGRVRKRSPKKGPWTLHRLLWSVQDDEGLWFWPAAAPSVGLPPRIALRMLRDALEASGDGTCWELKSGRRLWEVRDAQLRAASWPVSRREQRSLISLAPDWTDLPPHPVLSLPRVFSRDVISKRTLSVWAHLLNFFVAAQGSEQFLDHLLAAWPSPTPLEERWALRAAIALPLGVWKLIQTLLTRILHAADGQLGSSLEENVTELLSQIESLLTNDNLSDFEWDRVDVGLSLDRGELPIGHVSFPGPPPPVPSDLEIPESLSPSLRVRIAQVAAGLSWDKYRQGFTHAPPPTPRAKRQEIMSQIASAFSSSAPSPGVADGPIIFPEVTLPLEEETSFRQEVFAERRAALIGLLWNVVRFAVPRGLNTPPPTRYLVNEALLVVPVWFPGDEAIVSVRTFRIRKPLPTHAEYALAEVLSETTRGSRWQILPGTRWYRFVHSSWGDFTIAICSDLIDPAPWKSLQGQILHLFLVSYNQDIQLYDSMTWLRAYEGYTNVVATNHGAYGGSFAWTPLAGEKKEVARLRGNEITICADIHLPTASLLHEQRNGLRDAVTRSRADWQTVMVKPQQWKAPPPGYRVRPKP